MRRAVFVFLLCLCALALLLICMALSAASDPKVRTIRYAPDAWPISGKTERLVLLTDLHVSGPDMSPARLSSIVDTVNALKPDLVLLGGDFLSASKASTKTYAVPQSLEPLRNLRATGGVVAVMGNHDHWMDVAAVHRELSRARIEVLDNTAIRKGPLTVGGVDDAYTGHADLAATVRAMDRLGGVPILLSHSPDVFPATPSKIGLVLAGHTHCGQIALPLIGPLVTMSRYGRRFACGVVSNGRQQMIVSAGVGTSILPFRLNAPPDIWVIEVGG